MGKRTLLLSLAVLYALLLAAWVSSKNLMVIDEFFAWNLLSEPSFHHAIGSWAAGADSGGILYYTLLWPVVQITHGSVLAARLFSAFCYVLSGIVWWRTLSRFMDAQAAAVGVLLVWLSSSVLLSYIAQVRFYGPLLLFAALAVWTTLRGLQEHSPEARSALSVFVAHGCLVLIHMLGILYSGLILTACLLSRAPRRRSLVMAGAGAASWLLLLPCRIAIHNGSVNATSLYQPRLGDLLRYYTHFAAVRPVLIIAFLGLCWLVRDLRRRVPAAPGPDGSRPFGFLLCLAFFPAPLCLFALSLSTRPLGALRYLLPYSLCLCTLCACAIARLREKAQPRFRQAITGGALLLAVCLHLFAVRQVAIGPRLELGNLGLLAAKKPVVVADEQTFFELQYYASNPALQFHFLLPPERDRPSGMMATIAERGYFPHSLQHADSFEQSYPEFLYVANTPHEPTPWVTQDPTCQARPVGSVMIGELRDIVFDVAGCRPRT